MYRLNSPTPVSWADLNGNLETIQFQGIGLHPTNRNKVIGGSQDNGTEVYTGSLLWTETDGAMAVLPSLARPTATGRTIKFLSRASARTFSAAPMMEV
jgi:hypothetical protein